MEFTRPAFTRLTLVSMALFLSLLTGCGSLTSVSGVNSGASAQVDTNPNPEPSPNPYWENRRRLDETTKEAFSQAVKAMEEGSLETAERQFIQLSRSNPKLSGPWVNLGIIHYQRDELKEAENSWIKAIKLNRHNFDAYTNLALLKREQGQFDKAEAIYKTALAKWPDNAEMHCNLGILYDLYKGEQTLALQEYLACEQLSDEPPRKLRGWIVDLERRTQALAKN